MKKKANNLKSWSSDFFRKYDTVDISKIETFVTKKVSCKHGYSTIKPFLFLKLTTACGIQGWGEAFISNGNELSINRMIHEDLVDKSTFEKINPMIFLDRLSNHDEDFYQMCASSAFEIALWDILGKLNDKSIVSLIGGSSSKSKSVPIYANTWSDINQSDKDLIDNAINQIERNHDSIKIYPLQNRNISEASAVIKNLRKELGLSVNIMIDLECPEDDQIPESLEKVILDSNPYWYEEPFDGKEIDKFLEFKKKSKLKIVTGEKQSEIHHFKSLCKRKAVDIINPDISSIGGIIRMLKIADYANEEGILISPHCWNSMTVSASVMMSICCLIENNEKAEIFPEYISLSNSFSSPSYEIVSNEAKIRDRPGLGVIIDESELKKLSYVHQITLV